jgi:hypothetical protein
MNHAVVSSSHTQQRQKGVRELDIFYKVRDCFFYKEFNEGRSEFTATIGYKGEHAVAQLDEALCHNLGGRRLGPRWCHRNFSLTYCPEVDSAFTRNISRG